MVNRHVHLPSEVIRKVELVGGVTHRDLVKPAVAQTDGGLGGHDLERGVLRLVGKHSSLRKLDARHVLGAFVHVRGGGVLDSVENSRAKQSEVGAWVVLASLPLKQENRPEYCTPFRISPLLCGLLSLKKL